MRDLGLIKNDEPATRLFTQGMVIKDGAKMSKSKGNVVSPDDMVATLWGGCDADVLAVCCAAGSRSGLAGRWRCGCEPLPGACLAVGDSIYAEVGVVRVVNVVRLRGVELKLLRKLHQTIAKITQDFEGRWHFNTCIAAIMELVNEIQGADAQLAAGEVRPVVMRELMIRWCCCWRRLRRFFPPNCGRNWAARVRC